jgi:enoyl-CoA hydratase
MVVSQIRRQRDDGGQTLDYAQLQIERHGPVILCTFVNPPHGYMDRVTVEELDSFTAEVEGGAGSRAIVFRGGVPGVFIQHYSVHELAALAERLRERNVSVDPGDPAPPRQIDAVFRRLGAMPQVTIAAINGNAMGGGFEFCLACDLRVAEEGDYLLGLPEVNIGILPGAGGTQRLPRLAGTARALEMILLGRVIGPREAHAYGIVHDLAAPGRAVERALAMAERIAAQPARAVAHCKRLVRDALDTPVEQGLAVERTLFLDLLVSDEAVDRMSAMNRGERRIEE